MVRPTSSDDPEYLKVRLGGLVRRGNVAEAAVCRQLLADAGAERRVRRLLAADPPPTPAARARLALLLLAPFGSGSDGES